MEDTVDLGERLDPVRTLLRRAAAGDRTAASSLLDVLGPRIHGLGVHMTGSASRAGRLTVSVLRSCLEDAGRLAASGLPGEAAVLDRARRAAVATRPSGDVRSLVAPDGAEDRTRDRREVEVVRVLLALSPAQRALVESAAQGRFPYAGPQRAAGASLLARVLEDLVPFGGTGDDSLRQLAALDALALADDGEQQQLRDLTRGPETAGVHRRAIEAAARLSLLTALPPSQDLHRAVLQDFPASAPAAPRPEPAYHGDFTTPVLGTDSQRRTVGPPAVAGGVRSAAAQTPVAAPQEPSAARSAAAPAPAPAFAFRPADEAGHRRRSRRRDRQQERRRRRTGAPWLSRSLAAAALIGVLTLTWVLVGTRGELAESREFASAWAEMSVAPEAELVDGLSDNGEWTAVITDDGLAVRAEGVTEYSGQEVLQLWAVTDGSAQDLGVLEVGADGTVRHRSDGTADRLTVTREMAPRNASGTPSQRVVAGLDPEASGT